jgi:hypothetical protein
VPDSLPLRPHGRQKSRPSRSRGRWGEPYGVRVHEKRGVLVIQSLIQVAHALPDGPSGVQVSLKVSLT